MKDSPNPLDFQSSKVTGEPPVALSCVALFAVQHAIRAFREETGQSVKSFSVNSPVTVDLAQQACGITPSLLSF